MGMVGLRGDLLFVPHPASSYHHQNQSHSQHPHHHHHLHESLISDHHHHQHHHQNQNSSSGTALGIGVIPLLTSAPCLNILDENENRNRTAGGGGGGGIQFWQPQQQNQQQQTQSSNYLIKKPILINQQQQQQQQQISTNQIINMSNVGTSTSTILGKTCQDCGNQAKKDCSHQRCRTCCKSRGFDCSTHVKSTWVSAARRRDRNISGATTTAMNNEGGGGGGGDNGGGASSGSTSAVKKPRLLTSQTTTASHTSTSNNTPPRSFDTISSHHQDASFRDALPRQVRAPANFKCVRVTPISDGDDEYAYQAMVRIGGHVFKGFLYNKGVIGNESLPNMSELHLGGSTGGGGRNWASSSSPIMDPSDVYAASGGGFLGAGGINISDHDEMENEVIDAGIPDNRNK